MGVVDSRVGRISKAWIIHVIPSGANFVKFVADLKWELSRLFPY